LIVHRFIGATICHSKDEKRSMRAEVMMPKTQEMTADAVALEEAKRRAKAMTRQERVGYLRKRRWYRVPQGGSELWRRRNCTSRSLTAAVITQLLVDLGREQAEVRPAGA
jgi:hypothetical protein